MGRKSKGKNSDPPPDLLPLLSRPPACLEEIAQDNYNVGESNKEVEEEAKALQSHLTEQLSQLWDENATFQRLMYKSRNQHRRTLYFRRLSQVRRDLLLLQSFKLSDIVQTLTQSIFLLNQQVHPSKAASSKVQGLDPKDQQIFVVQRRLLGATRLLQQMADPILDASSLVAGLFSQSFFMPFALTMLAVLARLRVLLLDVLYEVVAVFNLVSANLQKMETSTGREEVPLFLECRWEGVKLEIFEILPLPQPGAPPPPQELFPLLTCLSGAIQLPDDGWFIDDRSTMLKEKLQSSEMQEPVLYEHEEDFILEDSPFELLGEDDVVVRTDNATQANYAPSSEILTTQTEVPSDICENAQLCKAKVQTVYCMRKNDLDEPLDLDKKRSVADMSILEHSPLEKCPEKRVAYVSVQVGSAKSHSSSFTGKRSVDMHVIHKLEAGSPTSYKKLRVSEEGSDITVVEKPRLTEGECPVHLHVKGTIAEAGSSDLVLESRPSLIESTTLKKVDEGAAVAKALISERELENVVVSQEEDVCVVEKNFPAQVPTSKEDLGKEVILQRPVVAGQGDTREPEATTNSEIRLAPISGGAFEASAVTLFDSVEHWNEIVDSCGFPEATCRTQVPKISSMSKSKVGLIEVEMQEAGHTFPVLEGCDLVSESAKLPEIGRPVEKIRTLESKKTKKLKAKALKLEQTKEKQRDASTLSESLQLHTDTDTEESPEPPKQMVKRPGPASQTKRDGSQRTGKSNEDASVRDPKRTKMDDIFDMLLGN